MVRVANLSYFKYRGNTIRPTLLCMNCALLQRVPCACSHERSVFFDSRQGSLNGWQQNSVGFALDCEGRFSDRESDVRMSTRLNGLHVPERW